MLVFGTLFFWFAFIFVTCISFSPSRLFLFYFIFADIFKIIFLYTQLTVLVQRKEWDVSDFKTTEQLYNTTEKVRGFVCIFFVLVFFNVWKPNLILFTHTHIHTHTHTHSLTHSKHTHTHKTHSLTPPYSPFLPPHRPPS